jgi:hypothetical protein
MNGSAHEIVLDLEPPVTTDSGLLYRASVVARAGADGHWNAWLEFVEPDSQEVRRTGIETHQASEANLHRWATMLGDVYLRGALERAEISTEETAAHREAVAIARAPLAASPDVPDHIDLFALFALGEHVLRRELQLFGRATLRALIINYDLNSRGFDLSTFSQAQLVAFIVTAVEVRQSRATR